MTARRMRTGGANAEMLPKLGVARQGRAPKLAEGRTYIGLSGGIGSGKSTVAQAFADLGATVISADQLARAVVEPGTSGLHQVVKRFGGSVLDSDGWLDRALMARIVFDDPQARADLEAITHPRIANLARAQAEGAMTPVVVYEVPLLVERQMADQFDLVAVVDAPEEARVARLVSRGLSAEDAAARIAAQATAVERAAVADIWIENHGSEQDLRNLVARIYTEWL